MKQVELNVYEIENLSDLKCKYKMYQVKGIPTVSDDFAKNVQSLIDRLTFFSRSPCVQLVKEGKVFIAQPVGFNDLPEKFDLMGTTVMIDKLNDTYEIDFADLDNETMRLALRFLQFSLQNPLYNDQSLWLPKAGDPFYYKNPDPEARQAVPDIDLYRGFKYRIIQLPNNRLGICIDTSTKYACREPLPTNLSADDFRKIKGAAVIYEYGPNWYEINLHELSDLNCSQQLIEGIPLYEYIQKNNSAITKSPLFMKLPKDSAVLAYLTNTGGRKYVPAGLCRRTLITEHPEIRKLHQKTILPPHIRRQKIQYIMDNHFRNVMFNNVQVRFSQKPKVFNAGICPIPDLQYGNGKKLSGPDNLENFPRAKKSYLLSKEAGFFVKKPFNRQYFIMPRSVYETYGKKFLKDIKDLINQIYATSVTGEYDPVVIPFDDSVQKSAFRIGNEILKAVKKQNIEFGFSVVMIPRLPSRKHGKEDQLANFIMRKLREMDIYASVIHTGVSENSLQEVPNEQGTSDWKVIDDRKQKGKYMGYLFNVVLNKILLLNNVFPFVLASSLKSDLVIGIDVKNHTAGFTAISKNADSVSFELNPSTHKEKLSKNQMRDNIIKVITDFAKVQGYPIKNVLFHRDGILFPNEKEGIKLAFEKLIEKEVLPSDANYNVMEIRKTSKTSVRIFDVSRDFTTQRDFIKNPVVGTFVRIEDQAFLMNTGIPYFHKGTSKPLQLIWHGGSMGFEEAIHDTFKLSNLTWTKVDDCSRYPLTIKMVDTYLREVAGDYSEDEFKFGENRGDSDE
jgi:hypothetical protein